jgi:hypothetical protein
VVSVPARVKEASRAGVLRPEGSAGSVGVPFYEVVAPDGWMTVEVCPSCGNANFGDTGTCTACGAPLDPAGSDRGAITEMPVPSPLRTTMLPN